MNEVAEVQGALRFLREHLVRTEAAIDALNALARHGAVPTELLPPAEAAQPPAAPRRRRKPRAARKARRAKHAANEDVRSINDRFIAMWNEQVTVAAMAKTFGKSTAWVYLKAKDLGLKKRPAASGKVKARKPRKEHAPRVATRAAAPKVAPAPAGEGESLAPAELLKFLREIGHKASATPDAGKFLLEGKPADAVALLEAANTWRRRNGQPVFRLKAG